MKILHVIETLDPSFGGPPKIAACIAAGQAALDENVRLASMTAPSRSDDVQKMLSTVPGFEALQNVSIARVPAMKQVLFKTIGPDLVEQIAWSDVVHIHNVWCPINLAAAAKAREMGRPYMILLNGMLDPWTLTQKSLKKKIFLKLRYREMLEGAAALHLGNRDEQRLIKPLGLKVPGEIIPNGVFPDEIAPPDTVDPVYDTFPFLRDKPFMLFMGRLHYKKGLDITAEAFARFAESNDEVQLVVAGPEGGAGDDLRARLAKHGLGQRVHIVGPVYGDLKWQLLHAADCFVLTTRQEGFSVAVTEALGCGLPCIVSEDCHYPEVGEADAGFVTPLTPEASAEAMRQMFAPSHRRQAMSANARALVLSRFTWPKIAQQTLEVYRRYRPASPPRHGAAPG